MSDSVKEQPNWLQRRVQKWLGIDEIRENQTKILAAQLTLSTYCAQILSALGETPKEYRTPDRHIAGTNRFGL